MVSSAFELLKDFVALKSLIRKSTKWTKTYDAMITAATCLRDNCNGK